MNSNSFEVLVSLENLPKIASTLANELLKSGHSGFWVSMEGQLGAGKTTFMRAVLQALGVTVRIKSPTYTLVETYQIGTHSLQHWDWYRLQDPSELEVLGFEEGAESAWVFVEWSSRFAHLSQANDLLIEWLTIDEPRLIRFSAYSERGQLILANMQSPEN